MNHAITQSSNRPTEIRTVLHAGSMMLGVDETATGLNRYLTREVDRHLVLVHHGQPALRRTVRETGVEDVRVAEARKRPEDALAADVAVALDAEELEFAIDRPALQSASGRLIGELTVRDAEIYASDPALRETIREKLLAGCDAIHRGVSRVRIGNPAALQRNRATVIVPDPVTAFDVAIDPPTLESDSESTPDFDPQRQPFDFPRRDPLPGDPKHDPNRRRPLVMRADSKRRRLRYSPLNGCEFGPRRFDPFPDSAIGFAAQDRQGGQRRRMQRAARKA